MVLCLLEHHPRPAPTSVSGTAAAFVACCFAEGVGQAILGALACGYHCSARAAPIDVLQLKRELQGCRGFATTGGQDHVNSLRWRSLMFQWRLGTGYISLWNETWGRETLSAPVVRCRVLRP